MTNRELVANHLNPVDSNGIKWKAAWSTFRGGFGSKGSFEEESAPQLPDDLKEGSVLHGIKAEVKEGSTLPPKHFTEASLLAAMEDAGNADMPKDAERKGIKYNFDVLERDYLPEEKDLRREENPER